MKKYILVLLMVMMGFITLHTMDAQENTRIMVNGEYIEFDNNYGMPFIDENYRTQVPVRISLGSLWRKSRLG